MEVWVTEYLHKGVWGISEVFTSRRLAEATAADENDPSHHGFMKFQYRVRRYVPDPQGVE